MPGRPFHVAIIRSCAKQCDERRKNPSQPNAIQQHAGSWVDWGAVDGHQNACATQAQVHAFLGKSMSASGYTAILLAAGQGLRIAGTTPEPKVLLDLYGRSLLERHLEAWAEVGFEHAAIVVGYKQDLIRDAVSVINTPLDIITITLPSNKKQNISLNWHLIENEKEIIRNAINLPKNKEEINKLKEILN